MDKVAEYITQIEIDSLWGGRRHVVWELNPQVNILSGINGVGKSTILNRAVASLKAMKLQGRLTDTVPGVHFKFYPEDATSLRFNVIRSFDRPLLQQEMMEKLSDHRVSSELDWQIYQLQRCYLDYQVNIANRIIELLGSENEEDRIRAHEESRAKTKFQDMIDSLFVDTGKRIDRKSNEIRFIQTMNCLGQASSADDPETEVLTPYQLSSGEKQMLLILLTVLVGDNQPGVMFMDEPEVSLHIEWQQRLIELVRELNPNLQIILTTHSPAVIMNGWVDAVTEVSDITF